MFLWLKLSLFDSSFQTFCTSKYDKKAYAFVKKNNTDTLPRVGNGRTIRKYDLKPGLLVLCVGKLIIIG